MFELSEENVHRQKVVAAHTAYNERIRTNSHVIIKTNSQINQSACFSLQEHLQGLCVYFGPPFHDSEKKFNEKRKLAISGSGQTGPNMKT